MSERRGWLIVFGEIEGFRWVVQHGRMAFTERTCPRAARIRKGDELVLYVGRGAFHDPTRDRSQLAGWATATSGVEPLPRPLALAGREFVCACDLRIRKVLPERQGVPIAPLIPRLDFIRRKDVWGQYLRNGLVELPPNDLEVLRSALDAGRTATRAGRDRPPSRSRA